MVYWITTIISTTFILIAEVNKQSSLKKTYYYVTWFVYNQIIQLKQRHRIVLTKSKANNNSDITGKKLLASLFTDSAYALTIGYSAVVS